MHRTFGDNYLSLVNWSHCVAPLDQLFKFKIPFKKMLGLDVPLHSLNSMYIPARILVKLIPDLLFLTLILFQTSGSRSSWWQQTTGASLSTCQTQLVSNSVTDPACCHTVAFTSPNIRHSVHVTHSQLSSISYVPSHLSLSV